MLPRRKVRLAKLVLEQPDLPKGRDEITSRGRRYAQVMAWVATVALLGGAGEFLAVSTAGASQTAKNHVQVKPLSVKFTLSGAGRGTITDNGQSACDYGGVNTDGATELSDLQGSVSGFKNVDSWTFNIIKEKGNGTFAIPPFAPLSGPRNNEISLQPILKDSSSSPTLLLKQDQEDLEADSGTVTIKGDSGSIKAAMWMGSLAVHPEAKEFKLVGTWNCK